jgi:serine/threonine-protein kinase PknK
VASRGTRVPLDPFAPVGPPPAPHSEYGNTLGSTAGGMTGGGTGGFGSQLGQAVDPRYAQLNGAPQASAPPVSAQPFSGAPLSAQPFSGAPASAQPFSGAPASAQPFSGVPASAAPNLAPYSAPPQAPVSMQPPMQWAAPAAPQAAPQQEQVFAPPVIGRDGAKQRKTQAYKPTKQVQPKQKDARSLKGYVVLGLSITVVLGLVMTLWLWLLVPNKGEEDLDQANTDGQGAPTGVAIATWEEGEVTLTWTAPEGATDTLRYIVFAQRVGDDRAEALNTEGTLETEFTTAGFSPDQDYCFQVSALWSVDEVPMSDPVCTADLAD